MRSLLSIKQVSEKLAISPPMVRKLAQHGAFKGAIKIGTIWRIPSSDVERALREGIQYPKESE